MRLQRLQTKMAATPIEILIVDDNPGDVLLTKEALRDARILNNVHVAPDGAEALAFLKREGVYQDAPIPDLVFLDLGMPRVDGFQVLAEMKADSELRRIPVIVMSSSDADNDLARAYDAQISAYLVKPIDLDSYFSAIRAIKEFWFNVVTPAPKARKASS
jgi:two-component system, chemotaxis family, response regulator Rcp1